MKHFLNENSYRKAACYCLQSRYGSVDISAKTYGDGPFRNSHVFNFAIFPISRKSRKFHAREICMVYSRSVGKFDIEAADITQFDISIRIKLIREYYLTLYIIILYAMDFCLYVSK